MTTSYARGQVVDLVAGAGAVEGEQHGHGVDRIGEVAVAAVQRLGGEVGRDRNAVAGNARSRRIVRWPPTPRADRGQRALACAVDTLDRDEHAASVARLMANPVVGEGGSHRPQATHQPPAGTVLNLPAYTATTERQHRAPAELDAVAGVSLVAGQSGLGPSEMGVTAGKESFMTAYNIGSLMIPLIGLILLIVCLVERTRSQEQPPLTPAGYPGQPHP